MAFFNFRLPGQSTSSASSETLHTAPAESLEVLRKRARHRLIGSVVLVLAAVIGFPLLFDTQPRPVSVDTPIVISQRSGASADTPASAPSYAANSATANTPSSALSSAPAPTAVNPAAGNSVAGTVSPHPIASATASGSLPPAGVLDANEEVVQATPRVADKASRVSESSASGANAGGFKVDFGKTGGAGAASAAAESKPDLKVQAATKPETKAAAPDKAKDEADKARALLDGKDPAKTTKTNEERLVIQVGAYTDATKVREARQKLENAGIKTYTQVIEGKDGKRTRVRVGPFDSKEEADKNAQKIRKLQLEASILKL